MSLIPLLVTATCFLTAPDAPTTPIRSAPSAVEAPVSFDLHVVLPSKTRRSLAWSPKGREVPFRFDVPSDEREQAEREVGPLPRAAFGTFELGHPGTPPVRFVLALKTPDATHLERLYLDTNRDGRLDPATERFDSVAKDVRGRPWVSFANVPIDVPAPDGRTIRHEFAGWIAYPQMPDDPFDSMRITRASWMEGTVTVGAHHCRVALIDANNDGRYTRHDRWVIVPEDDRADDAVRLLDAAAAPIAPCFIGDQAFRLMDVALSASRAAVRLGTELRPLPPAPKPERPKADGPPTWLDDLDAGRREAARTGRRLFVKWGASWCGPCHVMDAEALMDRAVVDRLNAGFVCVHLDFDAAQALARELRVSAIPTVHVFGPDGEELARHTGLLEPQALDDWLRETASDGDPGQKGGTGGNPAGSGPV
ncbi:MAG: thioredoxin family protein [Phycisphaerales bacterium]|nr:thioredoxin family protein [Phycisphaerales bacterium]